MTATDPATGPGGRQPDFDCSAFTVPIDDLDDACELLPPQPPLPPIVRPASEPLVDARAVRSAVEDPLVDLVGLVGLVGLEERSEGVGAGGGTGSELVVTEAYRRKGWPHTVEGAWLRRSVARRLLAARATLPRGFGLAVFDAWRPLALQGALHDAAYRDHDLPEGFVAPPSTDPATPPPHLTGATVDLTLSFGGRALALGSGFDDFTPAAHADHLESVPGSDHAREARRLLIHTMHAQGFVVLHCEWWHFEIGTRYWAAISGATPHFGAAEPGTA